MVNMDYYLGLKYANQAATANAQANLQNTQAANLVADQQARAKAAQTSANASLLDAQSNAPLRAAMASRTTALIDPEVGTMRAQAGLAGEQAQTSAFNRDVMKTLGPAGILHSTYQRMMPNFQIMNDLDAPPAPAAPSGATAALPAGWQSLSILPQDADEVARQQARRAQLLGTTAAPKYAKGTSKIPGKGSGKVDTVPAMLAPGEAVLNKGAAEHIGRDTIKHLNVIGQMKMGMVGKDGKKAAGGPKGKSAPTPAKGSKKPAGGHGAGGTQHFASGTDFVRAVANTAIGQIFGGQQPSMPSAQATAPAATAAPQSSAQRSVLDTDANGQPMYGDPTGGQPVRYATGHSNVGKGKKSDTPKPTAANIRLALGALKAGMPKKPLPKGFGNPGMV